ncbi:GNAT family N-acetyltransferase [Saccharothrix coeruleofusca]|uniref:GNAT family N-acetyltransferase n=1 Tax=Saccharothrix coeruleofusca TaxID=33919 RepID=UPI0016715891|nr:GNAT family N-acetyltransferase [Saccharothrix coeruleofusca]
MPEEYLWRPLRPADGVEWERLVLAFDLDDRPVTETTAAEFAQTLASGKLVPERDTVGVFRDGLMVGFAAVLVDRTAQGDWRCEMQGCVHPDHQRRGLGTRLLDWAHGRALARGATATGQRREVRAWCAEHNGTHEKMLRRLGLRPTLWYYEIYSRLDQVSPLTPRALPEGLRMVPYDPALDEEVRSAHNAAFVDQSEDGYVDRERWRRQFTGSPTFLPEMSLLVLDRDDAVRSYLLCYSFESGSPAPGQKDIYVGYIGTPPGMRGRSLYRSLLAENDRMAREAGYTGTAFSVNTANPTGALRLFEFLGVYDPRRDQRACWVCYAKDISTPVVAAPEVAR